MIEGYAGYVPVPIWDGNKWRPVDKRDRYIDENYKFKGYEEIPWPDGFDPSTLPIPKWNIGEGVRFSYDKGICHGEIRDICLHGGAYTEYDARNGILEICKERYFTPLNYTIYWNGHGRMIYENDILGV